MVDRLEQALGVTRTVNLTVWDGESEADAIARHLEAKPGDQGATFRFLHVGWMTRPEAMTRGWA
jgi:hypothetical protein